MIANSDWQLKMEKWCLFGWRPSNTTHQFKSALDSLSPENHLPCIEITIPQTTSKQLRTVSKITLNESRQFLHHHDGQITVDHCASNCGIQKSYFFIPPYLINVEQGCGAFKCKSCDALGYRFTLDCADNQPMRTLMTSNREIQTFHEGEWSEIIRPIEIFPLLYISPCAVKINLTWVHFVLVVLLTSFT